MTPTLAPVLVAARPPVDDTTVVPARVAARLLACSASTVKIMAADGRLAGGRAVDGSWWVTLGSVFEHNLTRLLPVCGACERPVHRPVLWAGPSSGLKVRMHADCADRVDATTRQLQHAAAARTAPPHP